MIASAKPAEPPARRWISRDLGLALASLDMVDNGGFREEEKRENL